MTPLFPDIHNARHPFRELTDTARSCASFEAQRAVHVSVNGPVDAQTADDLRAHGNVRMIRLTASEEQLRSRIAARVLGDGGARLGRDDLRGASESYQAAVLTAVVEPGVALDRDAFQGLLIETSMDPKSIADHVARSTS